MTATYWEIGRRIVEFEQKGRTRADYGERLLIRLSADLTPAFGRGLGVDNLQRMRAFFLTHPLPGIYATPSRRLAATEDGSEKYATVSRKSLPPTRRPCRALSGELTLGTIADRFPLPWSHYVRLLSVKDSQARGFYEAEALRGGWTVRQLDRQIGTLFYERTALSRNKAAMLRKGAKPKPEDAVTPQGQGMRPGFGNEAVPVVRSHQ